MVDAISLLWLNRLYHFVEGKGEKSFIIIFSFLNIKAFTVSFEMPDNWYWFLSFVYSFSWERDRGRNPQYFHFCSIHFSLCDWYVLRTYQHLVVESSDFLESDQKKRNQNWERRKWLKAQQLGNSNFLGILVLRYFYSFISGGSWEYYVESYLNSSDVWARTELHGDLTTRQPTILLYFHSFSDTFFYRFPSLFRV